MKLLIATDGTKYGEAAVEAVCKYSLGPDDTIHLISIIDMAVPLGLDVYSGSLPNMADYESAARSHAEAVIEQARSKIIEQHGDVKITTDILFGSPDSRIVETAEEQMTDLIVLGSHGYNRWERLLLGSVSDSVVHHAHCSVLIARTNEK